MSSVETIIVNDVPLAHIACVHKVIERFPAQVPEKLRGMTLEQVTEFVQHTDEGDFCNYDIIRDLIQYWADTRDEELRSMTSDMLKTAGKNPTLEDKLAAILLHEQLTAIGDYSENVAKFNALPKKKQQRLISEAEIRDDDKFNGGFMELVERALYRYIDCVHIPINEEQTLNGIDGLSESVSSVLASMFACNKTDNDEYTTWFMTYIIGQMLSEEEEEDSDNDHSDDSGDEERSYSGRDYESGGDEEDGDASDNTDTDDGIPTARMKRESKRRRMVHSPQASQSPVPSSQ